MILRRLCAARYSTRTSSGPEEEAALDAQRLQQSSIAPTVVGVANETAIWLLRTGKPLSSRPNSAISSYALQVLRNIISADHNLARIEHLGVAVEIGKRSVCALNQVQPLSCEDRGFEQVRNAVSQICLIRPWNEMSGRFRIRRGSPNDKTEGACVVSVSFHMLRARQSFEARQDMTIVESWKGSSKDTSNQQRQLGKKLYCIVEDGL